MVWRLGLGRRCGCTEIRQRRTNYVSEKERKAAKPKELRVYTVNNRKPAVIVLWLLFICGFVFAVYKNFTAIDTHTVHEKEIVERRVEDTSGVEAFVWNFAKTYYSWSNNKDSVAQRTDALTGYLTEDLQRLTADTVKRRCSFFFCAGHSDLVCGAEWQ